MSDDLLSKKDLVRLIDIFACYIGIMYKDKGRLKDSELRSFSLALNNLRNSLDKSS